MVTGILLNRYNMKTKKYFTVFLLLPGILSLLVVLSLTGCNDEKPKPLSEQVKAKLIAHPWKINSLSIDGQNNSSLLTNFTITFTPTSFTTVNGEPIWPTTSPWSFENETTANAIMRSDGIIVKLDEVTNTSLSISFTWNKETYEGGRSESIKGRYKLTLGL
jgi:hypothetical protein